MSVAWNQMDLSFLEDETQDGYACAAALYREVLRVTTFTGEPTCKNVANTLLAARASTTLSWQTPLLEWITLIIVHRLAKRHFDDDFDHTPMVNHIVGKWESFIDEIDRNTEEMSVVTMTNVMHDLDINEPRDIAA